MTTSPLHVGKKISQLTPYGAALAGAELLEIQMTASFQVTARDFVLPIDPVLTAVDMSSSLPASRQLIAGANITLTDQGPGQGLVIASMATGGGGGVTDHGALTGLLDDDHPQYLTDARGDAKYALVGSGVTDHGALTGLADDDHPQYLTAARGDALFLTPAEGDARYAAAGGGGAASSFVYVQSTDPYLNPANGVAANSCWVDTTSGTGSWVLKVRNAANTAWEVLRSLGTDVLMMWGTVNYVDGYMLDFSPTATDVDDVDKAGAWTLLNYL